MPRKAEEMGALAIKRLEHPGEYTVGGVAGLRVRVYDNGHKYWLLRATIAGRVREIGIGPYPEVTLAKAREAASDMRMQIREGIDPLAERRAAKDALAAATAKALTFSDCTDRYLANKSAGFRNEKHRRQWRSSLEQYADPIIGRLPVDRIELAHVLEVLQPVWRTRTETASRVRGRMEKVLDYATVSGYRDGSNPARWRGNLDAILPAPSKLKKVRHHRALPWAEVPPFMAALRERSGTAAQALQFLVLTATRSGEVRGATWDEIDLESSTWSIPAERMKAGRTHVVPLSDAALEILEARPDRDGLVFPGQRGGMLSDMSLSSVLKRMQVDATVHGFRSSFRDWVSETTRYPHEVAEMALAHTIPNATERAYRRGDLLEKRRALMDEWAAYIVEAEK
ncbi:site-specific integrase [Thioalkalivibrio sp. ALJ16]|uniref:tyrosine-type recombinase/integrase n=1 Tax=Thioalkalivibrio sp. ALJ16 TaxID=1158762 RepID=UPI0018CAEC91|nr:site-specific integrase [Thioalkalivibrio sp. ALJ16]